ncbi:heme/hemin ABC transporter substrate-binding protein [Celeribacter neptunius]|uniref:Iron complex transport system substrate-binding protein n=1 Tax=Celeribacter neptunius TaxID=588602 RepID=A0A1I3TJM3_9RHOB|nr:ABC transporter substrate-binding protein [Celeribacter neptunius]SFJ69821.1 iron complex transport system substrate-binding protein [Celeribacter neptunius]
MTRHLFRNALAGAAMLLPLSAQAGSSAQATTTATMTATAIVSVGGPVTETIFALGEGDRVVARDSTSLFPPEVTALPDIGYMRQLSAEAVLSTGPDLIVTRDTAGPPEVLDQLRAAAVPMVETHDGFNAEAVLDSVHKIGAALGVPEKSDALAVGIEADFKTLAEQVRTGTAPRVMFILSNQGGRLNVAGRGTGAHGILELAGAENVFASDYQGYKIASDEAIIAAAPDIILMMEPTGEEEHDARRADTLALPAIAQTPAGENGAFVLVPPAALGFGPRTAKLALALRADLLTALGD